MEDRLGLLQFTVRADYSVWSKKKKKKRFKTAEIVALNTDRCT